MTLAPEKNISYEAGVKVDVLEGNLSLTGAVFRIEKTNLRIPNDPSRRRRSKSWCLTAWRASTASNSGLPAK